MTALNAQIVNEIQFRRLYEALRNYGPTLQTNLCINTGANLIKLLGAYLGA